MKRAFVILLFGMIVLYAREGYDTWFSANHIKERITGILSDIAKEVTAIPLQSANGKPMEKVRDIKKDRNELFLISEDILYHYNKDGRFVCQVTDPGSIKVAGYLVNPAKSELIVLGNVDDIFYYTYEGELIETKKLVSNLPDRRILSMALHNNRILSMEENTYVHPDTQEVWVEKELVTYDTSFQKIESHKLAFADLGRTQYLLTLSQPQLCIDPDTGQLLVYNSPKDHEYLLQDTLRLASSLKQNKKIIDEERIPVVPIRPLGRFWFSSSSNPEDETMNFTFCYDRQTQAHKKLKDGFADDFYETGTVANLQAMDLYSQTFCFTQSGEGTKKAFPDNYHSGNAVVFIVKMKEA
ncbi:6-bladed beta-propeller [Parabacteroides sp. PF5-6]|uniref:6-bladed beta-propeller n=1 Tax=Parabacteroides sp. PF5-6 TaxID=1742403 RepID=UPI002404D628|nr:6-bladed beta-propeller [Parabacteroides sp. PF5-6]MDF9831281.1 hypothetical protein [Parabacteroides sp. PF5-6]